MEMERRGIRGRRHGAVRALGGEGEVGRKVGGSAGVEVRDDS
jgi:hypothetical protein